MRRALADFPGIAYSFSQPIACRIDEIVAGTRAQLIIKLFGDDLELLEAKASEIAGVLNRIPGPPTSSSRGSPAALYFRASRPGADRPARHQYGRRPGHHRDGRRRPDRDQDL